MNVVVPFVEIRPETEKALNASGWPWKGYYVGDADDSYYWLLDELWEIGETFVVIEHDIVVGPKTLDELEACRGEWCSFGFPYMGSPSHHGLGCVKFSKRLIARNPKALHRAGNRQDHGHPQRHWCRLDAWLQMEMRPEPRCFHEPPVGHAKEDSHASHGCA